jgi:hypothetical protein
MTGPIRRSIDSKKARGNTTSTNIYGSAKGAWAEVSASNGFYQLYPCSEHDLGGGAAARWRGECLVFHAANPCTR